METSRINCWVSYEISLFLSFRDNDMKNKTVLDVNTFKCVSSEYFQFSQMERIYVKTK